MDSKKKTTIIENFKQWFRDNLVLRHKANTEKLTDVKKFNINPFLLHYLSYYLEGNANPETLAKILVYPRVLGTSVSTSFGNMIQRFTSEVLNAYGSTTSGIDIEFIDFVDKRKKYCQLKSGPNVINGPDVTTVKNHFRNAINLARANNVSVQPDDFVFCLIYGNEDEKNTFIRKVERDYPVYIGKEFWYRFTGDENFYKELIGAAGEVAKEVNMKKIVECVIAELSTKIDDRFSEMTE